MILKLEKVLNEALKELDYELEVKVIKSKEENVDFQCDDLFKLAKKYHKAPMFIGEEVIEKLNSIDNFDNYFKSVSLAKPGFINICVSDELINSSLRKLINKENFGVEKEDKTIVLDYGGPNVAKPLHVGHLRAAVIGQAIYNILTFKGNKVIGDVHLGDIGTQMGQVIYGILHDFKGQKVEDIEFDLNYLNVTYPKISGLCKEDENVRNECLKITKELQDGREEYVILWEKIRKISIEDIKRIYNKLNVHFDYWYGESDAYKYFDEMMPFISKQNIIRVDDGAKIIDIQEEEDKAQYPPCIIQKKDGAYLYATSDLATIWQRVHDFDPDNIEYVVDSRQGMYFEKQIFRIVKKAHIYEKELAFHGFGTVNGRDNKPFKTRTGGALKLEDLISDVKKEFISLRNDNKSMDEDDLNKIVTAIINFADLQNDLTRNYIFDIKKFTEVSGKTGPYILYTYLRINKLLTSNDGNLSDKIYNDADRKLRLKLLEVTDVIEQAANERRPHYIAGYLYELCSVVNNFYGTNKISEVDDKVKNDFDLILSFNNKILKTLLGLLAIEIPKKM